MKLINTHARNNNIDSMKTEDRGVSVLVAAYNAETTIRRCLDSLLQQTLGDVEVVCVDDCSTDSTREILQDYANKDCRVKVLRTEENSGQAVARNIGLKAATKPFVCMVDADDWLSADALESAMDVFEQYPQTDCVLFRLMRFFGDECDNRADVVEYGLPDKLLDGGFFTGKEAIKLSIDGWRLHGLYVTRTELHRRIPFDTSTRLYSDDNTTHLHYLHSREVRACKGQYVYRQHASMTSRFNVHHFDMIEANYSLKRNLTTENVDRDIIATLERHRWNNFVVIYRTYLKHRRELREELRKEVEQRLHNMLGTFSFNELSTSQKWKPGYWPLRNGTAFDVQQKMYMLYKRLFDKAYISEQLA